MRPTLKICSCLILMVVLSAVTVFGKNRKKPRPNYKPLPGKKALVKGHDNVAAAPVSIEIPTRNPANATLQPTPTAVPQIPKVPYREPRWEPRFPSQ